MRKVLVLALLLACLFSAPAVHASSACVSRKAYAKETSRILAQYAQELDAYVHVDHPGTAATAVNLYMQRASLDFFLVQTDLGLYDQHKRTQEDVDASLRQLSRDLEDVPPAVGK